MKTENAVPCPAWLRCGIYLAIPAWVAVWVRLNVSPDTFAMPAELRSASLRLGLLLCLIVGHLFVFRVHKMGLMGRGVVGVLLLPGLLIASFYAPSALIVDLVGAYSDGETPLPWFMHALLWLSVAVWIGAMRQVMRDEPLSSPNCTTS